MADAGRVALAPEGIDNKAISNCTTQFLGKQNATATIRLKYRDLAAPYLLPSWATTTLRRGAILLFADPRV